MTNLVYKCFSVLHSGSGENDVKLPAFLTADGGINSGFMIAHCTSAALGERLAPHTLCRGHCVTVCGFCANAFCVCVTVSENKVLTHPSSVDSISTSAAQEDHVSMGGFSARKAIRFAHIINKNLHRIS